MTGFKTINGVKLMVDDRGQGPAVLTLHGGPGMGSRNGNVETFGPFADEGYRVVSYDQRGNGESDDGPPYSHEQFTADAESLRVELGLGKIVVAGGSYGGFLSMEYALRYPENLAGLILRDTAASNKYGGTSKDRALASHLPGINEEMLDRLFAGKVASDEEFREMYRAIDPLYWVNASESEREKNLAAIRFRHKTHNYAFGINQPKYDIVSQLGSINVPTLVLVGRHDWITPLEASEEIARTIPDSKLVIFEQSGHAPQVEERDRFLGEVRAFLTRVFK